MNSNYQPYIFDKSLERVDSILSNSTPLEELDYIPSKDKLTYSNGFYINCSALFADIRESSSLTDSYNRPKIAKLYRAYISEVVAIINGNEYCSEIKIVGDCVSGIFSTPYPSGIIAVVSSAYMISSLIQTLNCKFSKAGIAPIQVGIGISYGRALMVQAGFQGSKINDIVWMGDVVNEACKLSGLDVPYGQFAHIRVSNTIYNNLDQQNADLFRRDITHDCYQGNIINIKMKEWYDNNCNDI